MRNKRLYLIAVIVAASLLTISVGLMFLSGLDAGGYSFVTLNSKLIRLLTRFAKNVPHCLAVIGVFVVLLTISILTLVINIRRSQTKRIFTAIIPLISSYVITLLISYFFTGIFGKSFLKMPFSYLGFVFSILSALSIVFLFFVDVKFGHKKVLYVIQDPLPGFDDGLL